MEGTTVDLSELMIRVRAIEASIAEHLLGEGIRAMLVIMLDNLNASSAERIKMVNEQQRVGNVAQGMEEVRKNMGEIDAVDASMVQKADAHDAKFTFLDKGLMSEFGIVGQAMIDVRGKVSEV